MAWSKQATILGPPGPAPSGTGLVKTAAGILVNPAALLVNADVDAAAAIAESKLALASDAAAETASRRTLGTGALQACAGSDARLSNARTPSVHAATHVTAGGDTIAAAVAAGNAGLMTGADKRKIDGIAVKASVASASGFASDTYLVGSLVTITAYSWAAGQRYHCVFDMAKTAAGTATPVIIVRMGTLGTTGDTPIITLTFGAGTAATDTGIFDVWVNVRSVGAGTAVIEAVARCGHALAATGLTSTGAAGSGIILVASVAFNLTSQTRLGLSFNGGTGFVGTNQVQQAELLGP